ncbi:MAG: hypothetical protein NXH75_12800 [Halobacteriovoraceae bacterium]|nr:hypothetical protein [Halobacteriovoraceae bacterium]
MTKNFFLFLGALLVLISSCEDKETYTKLNSFPEWSEEKFKTGTPLYIFMVGGFSETLFPATELKPSGLPKEMPHALKVGGLAIMTSYLNTIKERFPDRSLILGMTGSSSVPKDLSKEKLIFKSMKQLPLDSLLLTKKILPIKSNREGNKENEEYNGLPWLNSNILSIQSGDPIESYGNESYKIVEKAGVKIGLLGVSSFTLLNSKERNEISGYYFQDPVTTVLKYKDILKKKGADFIVLLLSTRNSCNRLPNQEYLFFKDLKDTKEFCSDDFEAKTLLDRLPPLTIDLILTDQENTTATLYRNTPIVSLYKPNQFISGIRLSFERDRVNFEESLVLPQVKLCHQMFAGTQDCIFKTGKEEFDSKRFDILEKSAFGLVSSRFLGKEIRESPEINQVINGK